MRIRMFRPRRKTALAIAGALTLCAAWAYAQTALEILPGGRINISNALDFGDRTGQFLTSWSGAHGWGVNGSTTYQRSSALFGWFAGGKHSDTQLDPGEGGQILMWLKSPGASDTLSVPKARKQVTGILRVGKVQGDSICAGGEPQECQNSPAGQVTASTVAASGAVTASTVDFGSRNAQLLTAWGGAQGWGVNGYTTYQRSVALFGWFAGGKHSDTQLDPGEGGQILMWLKSPGSADTVNVPEKRRQVTGVLRVGSLIADSIVVNNSSTFNNSASFQGRILQWDWSKFLDENLVREQKSDLRLKTNINVVPDSLEKVRKLRGVFYHWNQEALDYFTSELEKNLSAGAGATPERNHELWRTEREKRDKELSRTNVGVIAQDVEAVLPEAVTTDEKGFKSVRYSYLIPLLIEALKEEDGAFIEQKQTVAQQQAEIERLMSAEQATSAELETLKDEFERLKAAVNARPVGATRTDSIPAPTLAPATLEPASDEVVQTNATSR